MAEPVKGVAYEFPVGLDSVLDIGFQVNPTIALGDFTISRDGDVFDNLSALPVVTPAGSTSVLILLSASEMDADKIVIFAQDQAGDEWEEMRVFIDAPAGSSETVLDIIEGDINESNVSVIIKKKGTETVVLEKNIEGSLLSPSITVNTSET